MNHYRARQLKDGGWHFTCMNDGRAWPVGYCAEHEPHATKEEACGCYRKWLLDNRLKLNCRDNHQQRKCKECGEWTSSYAMCETDIVFLCDKHMNRETFEKIVPVFDEMWSSW